MKILIYTLGLPPYRRGGLVRYSIDLAKELSRDNEVTLLFPGRMYLSTESKKIRFKFYKKFHNLFNVYEMINPLPVSLNFGVKNDKLFYRNRNEKNIKKFIDHIKPEVIHLQTIMGLPMEFINYAKKEKIKIILTTHDFYGLCPKMLESPLKRNMLLKKSQCTYDCFLCPKGPSWLKIYIMQSRIYRILKQNTFFEKIRISQKKRIVNKQNEMTFFSDDEVRYKIKLRRFYIEMLKKIDLFHFNSKVSEEYVKRFLPCIQGKILYLSHYGLSDRRTEQYYKYIRNKHKNINILYIGPYDKKKGFFLIKDAIYQMSKKFNNFSLHFCGDILKDNLFNEEFVVNHGILKFSEVEELLSNMDLLIVPSLWHETFGFNTLEALSFDLPVLCSNTVGARDLVKNNELIFKNKKELICKLDKILSNADSLKKYRKEILEVNLPLDFSNHVKMVKKMFYED